MRPVLKRSVNVPTEHGVQGSHARKGTGPARTIARACPIVPSSRCRSSAAATARSSRPTISPPRPGSRSSGRAARRSMRRSPRTPSSAWSLPRLRHRRRRVLADLGRGATGGSAALNGSGRSPGGSRCRAALRRAGPRDAAAPRRRWRSRCPGAVRSWGDAHDRLRAAAAGGHPRPRRSSWRGGGFPAWDGFIAAVEADARRLSSTALGADAAWFAVYRPHGRPWRPGERVRLPALAATLERIADEGWDEFYEGEIAERPGARRSRPPARRSRRTTSRTHTSTWTEPIETTTAASGSTTHPPNSSGIVALELLNILERFEPPRRRGVRPTAVAPTPRWIHLGIEASKLAMADRDAT